MTDAKQNPKKTYQRPQVQTYSSTDLLSDLGPALAVYGETGPNP
jgi:hypothetical protein